MKHADWFGSYMVVVLQDSGHDLDIWSVDRKLWFARLDAGDQRSFAYREYRVTDDKYERRRQLIQESDTRS